MLTHTLGGCLSQVAKNNTIAITSQAANEDGDDDSVSTGFSVCDSYLINNESLMKTIRSQFLEVLNLVAFKIVYFLAEKKLLEIFYLLTHPFSKIGI